LCHGLWGRLRQDDTVQVQGTESFEVGCDPLRACRVDAHKTKRFPLSLDDAGG